MRTRTKILIAGVLLAIAVPALADLNYTEGDGVTRNKVLFDFICFTTKHCPAHVNTTSAGAEIFTSSTPGQVQVGDGTNQVPIKAASTAAAASDKSFVTNESPNSQLSTAVGTTADAAWSSGSGTLIAIGKAIVNAANSALAAGTNYIGQSSTDPSQGGATPTFVFQALPATATTKIITASGSTVTYITSLAVLAGGTTNWTIKYGTGTNCGTGTTTLAGPYPLTAQAGFTQGAGTGAVVIVPAGKDTCITTDASVSGGTHMTYQQK